MPLSDFVTTSGTGGSSSSSLLQVSLVLVLFRRPVRGRSTLALVLVPMPVPTFFFSLFVFAFLLFLDLAPAPRSCPSTDYVLTDHIHCQVPTTDLSTGSNCKRRNFLRKKVCVFPSQTYHTEFIFVLSNRQEETAGGDRKACKPGGRKFGVESNFVNFSIIRNYEIKFPMNISSFRVTTELSGSAQGCSARDARAGARALRPIQAPSHFHKFTPSERQRNHARLGGAHMPRGGRYCAITRCGTKVKIKRKRDWRMRGGPHRARGLQ